MTVKVDVAGTTVTIEMTRLPRDMSSKVEAYLDGEQPSFNGDIDLSDRTAFQRNVLEAIRSIPYGRTVPYSHVARRVGRGDAARAVANACGSNPCPIVIPCHRVVAADGLGGYRYGAEVKEALLELEDAL